jgi:hypothetical protein
MPSASRALPRCSVAAQKHHGVEVAEVGLLYAGYVGRLYVHPVENAAEGRHGELVDQRGPPDCLTE